MRLILLIFGITNLLLFACEDPLEIEIPVGTPRIVVEGWVTNDSIPHSINITRTVGFSASSEPMKETGANVSIITTTGEELILEETSAGLYQSPISWRGVIGEGYACMIELRDGTNIQSDFETLNPVPDIDSIYFRLREPPVIVDGIAEEEYLLTGVLTDPAGMPNYYRWEISVNGQVLLEPSFIFLFDDRFFDGNTIPFEPRQLFFNLADEVSINQISLTASAFDYYSLLVSQATTLGQSSGTSPAVLRGNLFVSDDPSQVVLGYFGAYSQARKSATVARIN